MKFVKELSITNSAFFKWRFRSLAYSSSPPPQAEHNIVSAALEILKHQRSKSRWTHLRAMLTPTATTPALTPPQFSQIILQIRNKPHLVLNFFLFTVRQSLCSHSLSSYATTIHILSRSRHKTEAQRLIHIAIRDYPAIDSSTPPPIFEALVKNYRDCDSAPFVFDLLISACIESKRLDQSMTIVRMLRSRNIFPRISTCCALIDLVVKTQGSFEGYDLYKEIFWFDTEIAGGKANTVQRLAPNSDVFNVIMVGFYRDGLVKRVEEVWGEMKRVNSAPNEYSYSILIATYCEAEKMEDAVRVWKEMEEIGMKHDIVAYNTIIGGFCRVGDVSMAEEFYKEMVMSGLESTCATYEHLISGYCKIEKVDSMLLLYKDMRRKNFIPGASTITVMIEALCIKSMTSEASKIFLRALKDNTFPEERTFVFLITGLCQKGSMEEALKLQAQMVGHGYEPDEAVYDAFVNGYTKQGNSEMVQRLRRELLAAQIPHLKVRCSLYIQQRDD